MATNTLPLDGLSADAKRVGMSVTYNTPTTGEWVISLATPTDWTLQNAYVTSNDVDVDITFSLKVDGSAITGYTAITYDDNSSVGVVTANYDIDSDERVSIDFTSVTDPGLITITLIGVAR